MDVKNAEALRQLILDEAMKLGDDATVERVCELVYKASLRLVPNGGDDDLRTASCQRLSTGRYAINFHEGFLAKCEIPTDCLFILLHEIEHIYRDDSVRPGTKALDRAIANVVEDTMINARLCRRFFPVDVPIHRVRQEHVPLFHHIIIHRRSCSRSTTSPCTTSRRSNHTSPSTTT